MNIFIKPGTVTSAENHNDVVFIHAVYIQLVNSTDYKFDLIIFKIIVWEQMVKNILEISKNNHIMEHLGSPPP